MGKSFYEKFGFLMIVLGFFPGFLMMGCKEKYITKKPEIKSITQSIYASLTIEPRELYHVYTPSPGIIDHIYVEEGDLLRKGEVIADISANNEKIDVSNKSLELQLAKENYSGQSNLLTKIKIEIKQAKTTLLQDSIDFMRQKRLWMQNIGSKSDFDRKKLTYKLSQESVRNLVAQYEQTEFKLKRQYGIALNNLRKSKTSLGDYTLQSKMEGRLYKLYKEEGELANFQEPIAMIGMADEFIIKLLIDEVDVSKLLIGQLVLITLDAYKDQVYEGRLTRILPTKDSETQTFGAEAVFKDPPKTLLAGLSGEANIIIDQREGILTIPIEYLMSKSRVRTLDGIVEIDLGIQGMDYVEVVAGIDSTDTIVKP